jgi:hypothetical protein
VLNSSLQDALEGSIFLLPELTGKVESLAIPGVTGRITPSSDCLLNLVGSADLDSLVADATILQVYNLFSAQQKEFGWIVGPGSKPTNLAKRLRNTGLIKIEEWAGMVLTDLPTQIPENPNVRVVEVGLDQLDEAGRLLGPAMEISVEGGRIIIEAMLLSPVKTKRRVYLAFWKDEEDPVACATLVHLPNQPIALLFCAGTLGEYRQRGIYRSLVRRRLIDAYQGGARAVIIQAAKNSSAPICKRLGFRQVCSMEWYAWFPQGADASGWSAM